MAALLAEACMQMANATTIVDFICDRLVEFCTALPGEEDDRFLTFDMGRAILRASEKALLMRVEADDLVACHSIKMTLEGSIFEIGGITQTALLWIAARKEPFLALSDYPRLARTPQSNRHDRRPKSQ